MGPSYEAVFPSPKEAHQDAERNAKGINYNSLDVLQKNLKMEIFGVCFIWQKAQLFLWKSKFIIYILSLFSSKVAVENLHTPPPLVLLLGLLAPCWYWGFLFVFQTSFPSLLYTGNTPGISQVPRSYFFRKAEEGGRACLWAGEVEITQKKPLWLSCWAGWVLGCLHAPGVPRADALYLAGSWSETGFGVGCGDGEGEGDGEAGREGEGKLSGSWQGKQNNTHTLIGICQANCSYFCRRHFAYILTKNPGPELISLQCNEKYFFSAPFFPSCMCFQGTVVQSCA